MKKVILASVIALGFGSVPMFGSSITRPGVVEKVLPVYPTACVSSGVEGGVIVEGMVNERGELVGANVVNAANPELAKAALEAVASWKFAPATKDGSPVSSVVRLPVEFRLDAERVSHMDPSFVAKS